MLFTNQPKSSHSYTGYEVGYFSRSKAQRPFIVADVERLIIPFCVGSGFPDTADYMQGVDINPNDIFSLIEDPGTLGTGQPKKLDDEESHTAGNAVAMRLGAPAERRRRSGREQAAKRRLERGPVEPVAGREETGRHEALAGQDRLGRHLSEHQPNPERGYAEEGRPPQYATEGRGELGLGDGAGVATFTAPESAGVDRPWRMRRPRRRARSSSRTGAHRRSGLPGRFRIGPIILDSAPADGVEHDAEAQLEDADARLARGGRCLLPSRGRRRRGSPSPDALSSVRTSSPRSP